MEFFGLISSVYMFFITLATSGIKLAATKIISEELVSNHTSGVRKAMKQCIVYSLTLGTISGIVLFLLSPFIATHWIHNKVSYIPFYILSISLPFMSVTMVINGYFSALRKAIKTASAQIIEQFIQIFVASYLLSIFLPKGISYVCLALVLGMVIAEILSCLYLYLLYKLDSRRYSFDYKSNLDYKKKIFSISIPVSITSYIRSGLSTLKQILIPIRLEKSGLSCDQALSKYGIINGMAMPIIMFPSVFILVFSELLIPEITDYNYTKSHKQIKYVIKRVFKISIIFSIIVWAILFIFGDKLSIIFYNNPEVSFYLKAFAFLAPFIYLDIVIDNILKGLNKQVSVMLINILDLIVTTSLIYFLLPIYGANGYIAILFISELLNFTISLLILRAYLNTPVHILTTEINSLK